MARGASVPTPKKYHKSVSGAIELHLKHIHRESSVPKVNRAYHRIELRVARLCDTKEACGVHHLHGKTGQPAGDARAWRRETQPIKRGK